MNSNDDRGVVSGRWDGEYKDGVAPTRWTGSVPILRRWSEAGAKRVRYGQCWVFSGVACTGEEMEHEREHTVKVNTSCHTVKHGGRLENAQNDM